MTKRTFLTLLSAFPAFPQSEPQLQTYTNARYGFSLSYPPSLLAPQGESENGDGQTFLSKDKSFQLAAWASYNALEHTLAATCESYIKIENKTRPFRPSYKVIKSTWYVYSGVSGPNIIYQKGYLHGEVFSTIRLEYPQADKEKLAPLVNKIIASFTPAK